MVELIERLIGKGYELAIYDRNVSLARLTGANRDYILNLIPHISGLMRESIDDVLEVFRGSGCGQCGCRVQSAGPEAASRADVDRPGTPRGKFNKDNYVGICGSQVTAGNRAIEPLQLAQAKWIGPRVALDLEAGVPAANIEHNSKVSGRPGFLNGGVVEQSEQRPGAGVVDAPVPLTGVNSIWACPCGPGHFTTVAQWVRGVTDGLAVDFELEAVDIRVEVQRPECQLETGLGTPACEEYIADSCCRAKTLQVLRAGPCPRGERSPRI